MALKCKRCGKELVDRVAQTKYCLECKKIVIVENARKYRKEAKYRKKPKPVKERKKPKMSISEVMAKAKAQGMSYGEWVAQNERS